MQSELEYFIIEKENLKGKKIFPFQIFIFNPIHKKFSMVLNGNRPITPELASFIDYLISKGGKLAILRKQKKTFLNAQEIKESEIPTLATRELHTLEKEHIMQVKLFQMYEEKNGKFIFQSEFEKAVVSDNFEKIIEVTKLETMAFRHTESPTNSLAIQLAKSCMNSDNFLNRVVAISFHLAKTINIKDQTSLADLICAGYFMQIGLTQMPVKLSRTATLKMSTEELKLYKKHPILSHHLLKKETFQLSERSKKIVLDHHERVNGSGFPSGQIGENLDILTLILASTSQLFEFSSGKITGNKQSLKSTIYSIKNKTFTPGLDFDFGDKIYESIITLINMDKNEKKSA
jgi:response regulator RpfG family c-di-GMP phosphodiesterase